MCQIPLLLWKRAANGKEDLREHFGRGLWDPESKELRIRPATERHGGGMGVGLSKNWSCHGLLVRGIQGLGSWGFAHP